MDYYGYAGTILQVDLSTSEIRKESLNLDLAKAFIGGFGINHRLAYDLIKPEIDPFSPENPVILGAGPLVGTNAPGTVKILGTTKFPLNGAVASGAGSMSFGAQLKYAGYDHIAITGKAESPVYLLIEDDHIEIRDAQHLWGKKDLLETTESLWDEHGRCGVVAVGLAGENQVKYALTMVDKTATLGAGGLGGVMGSKNLKAIVVKGSKGIAIADRKRFMKVIDGMYERVKKYPEHQTVVDLGIISNWSNYSEQLFTDRNFTEIPLIETITELYGPEQYKKVLKHRQACPSCFIGHRDVLEIRDGEHKGLGMYIHTFLSAGFLSKFGRPDYRDALKVIDDMNRYGLCLITTIGLLDFIIDLYERKLITSKDTGGLILKRDSQTFKTLLEKIVHREGFGDILADGWLAFFERFGRDLQDYAMVVKGNDIRRDPRICGLGTHPFSEIVTPRGPQSASGTGPSYMPGQSPERFRRHSQRMGAPPESMSRMYPSDKECNIARMTKWSEDWYSLLNCLGICEMHVVTRFYHIDTCAELYSAVTGIEMDAQELMTAAERSWNIYKMSNVREGFSRKDDTFPKKWLEPIRTAEGKERRLTDYYQTKTLTKADLEQMLDDYYDERGWDKEKGIPNAQKLAELGLSHVVHDPSKQK